MGENRRVLVLGTGKSGIEAAKLILRSGGEAVLYNSNESTDRDEVLSHFPLGSPVELITGKLYQSQVRGAQIAVVSPGIPLDADFVGVIAREGIPVISELEMAYQASKGRIAAITGTNGKTTTTALVGEILKKKYKDVHVVGNIGEPFSSEALDMTDESVTSVEVSSFMLEAIYDFHPFVSAILNITPDHLNRHKTMENYIRCKENIALNQTESDYIVLNYDDPVLREFGEKKSLRPKVIWFSSRSVPPEGFWYADDAIFYRENGITTQLCDVHELNLLGRHNYENVMAAAAIGLKMGVGVMDVADAVRNFKAVEHRIEFVRERGKVRYYNDSKGTNPDAAIQALNAMPGPTILIGGGYDKKNSYDDWVRLFPGKVKELILLGQTAKDIAACCRKYGFDNIIFADSMEEAVRIAASYADEGDSVLLSPACASWGMFKNFEERGQIFKDCVRAL